MNLRLFVSPCSDEEEAADGLEILMEAPEGFRNSDDDHFSESQVKKRIWRITLKELNVSFMENTLKKKKKPTPLFLKKESSVEDVQDLRDLEMPEEREEHVEEKGDEPHGERRSKSKHSLV